MDFWLSQLLAGQMVSFIITFSLNLTILLFFQIDEIQQLVAAHIYQHDTEFLVIFSYCKGYVSDL